MKIIISPAKKMNTKQDSLGVSGLPCYLEDTEELLKYMKGLTFEKAQEIWKCNTSIAEVNYRRFASMELTEALSPAILSYEGIQYQYMAPEVFDQSQLDYISRHLCILSGFYGVVSPFDGVVPYRLEMQAKIDYEWQGKKTTSLYDFWGDKIYRKVTEDDNVILNLASKEYSKAIELWLEPDVHFISCVFGSMEQGKLKVKGTEAKMARGEMVRYLAEKNIQNPGEIRGFTGLGYVYQEMLSDASTYVFLK